MVEKRDRRKNKSSGYTAGFDDRLSGLQVMLAPGKPSLEVFGHRFPGQVEVGGKMKPRINVPGWWAARCAFLPGLWRREPVDCASLLSAGRPYFRFGLAIAL